MTITKQDLVIIKSEDMTDNATGGGLPSKNIVMNGKSNEIFDDVSDLQKVMGGVSLRKVFAGVMTDNDDKLLASRIIITQLPTNKNVSVFMFNTDNWADRRNIAESKLTSYLSVGSRCAGHLLENHLAGQSVIQLSLHERDPVPVVGDVLALIQNEGLSDEFSQFICVLKVSTMIRTFQRNAENSVKRVVATLEISEPLRKTFNGLTVQEFYQNVSTTRRTVVRETRVAKANKIFSASKLSEAVRKGETQQVRLNSIFTQVVPSSQIETVLPMVNPVGQSQALIASNGKIQVNMSVNISTTTPFFVGSGIYPSSLQLLVNGRNLSDVAGELKDSNGVAYASIDYGIGSVNWYANAGNGFTLITGSYIPAGTLIRSPQTEIEYVGTTDIGKSYIRTLQTKPLKGSLSVSYQSSNRVYVANDDGKGSLVDNNNEKYGVVDYGNSLITLVLPALPDSDSAIIFSYQTDLGTINYGGQSVSVRQQILMTGYTLPPFTNITVTIGDKTGLLKDGKLTGDITGLYDGRELILQDVVFPSNTQIKLNYEDIDDKGTLKQDKFQIIAHQLNQFQFNIGKLEKNSFYMIFRITDGYWMNDGQKKANLPDWSFALKDNGQGTLNLYSVNGATSLPNLVTHDLNLIVSGTIDYQTGSITVSFSATATIDEVIARTEKKTFLGIKYNKKVIYEAIKVAISADVKQIEVQYWGKDGTSSTQQKIVTVTPSYLFLQLPMSIKAPVVVDSVSIAGMIDNNGKMLKDEQEVGTIDYLSGKIVLDSWDITTTTVMIDSAVREFAPLPMNALVFRSPVAPLKVGSVQILLDDKDGRKVIVPNNKGEISVQDSFDHNNVLINGVTGFVDYRNGIFAIYANNINASSVSYNATAYRHLPLPADVIGIDTSRLPSDGRVPFVRIGDFAVISEEHSYLLENPTPSKQYSTGVERLTSLEVMDSRGKVLDVGHVGVDLDTGNFNLTDSFQLVGYTPPLTARYRVADYAVVTQTDINGLVTLATTVSHDYSTNAVFSTALISNGNGTVQARAFGLFSQKAWDGKFYDETKERASIQYQVATNPIVVTNKSAITERWALIFTGTTSFKIVGETLGEIGTGSTLTTTAPLNPVTNQPYFSLSADGWSGGGSVNNVLRFNTTSATPAIWIGSAIQPHQGNLSDVYDFSIEHQANVDRKRN